MKIFPTLLSGASGSSSGGSNPSSFVGRKTTAFPLVATGTTQIPADNTIPQNSEGDQYMTITYTAANANNILEIDVSAFIAASQASTVTMALFQDSNVNALAATAQQITSTNQGLSMSLLCSITVGTAASTTFTVRIGSSVGATTVTFNGASGTQRYGGVMSSGIRIREYTA